VKHDWQLSKKEMKKLSVLLASTAIVMISWHQPADAIGIPVVDIAGNIQLAKDAVIQGKQYAQEIKGWLDVAGSYATAVQNTVAIPAAAVAQVNALYFRATSLTNSAAAIAGPNGTMMQRFAMMQNLGRAGSGLPGDIAYSFEFWDQQRRYQMEEDAKLLGLEEERRAIEDAFLTTATKNSAQSIGALQALQAQGQITAASAAQVQRTNQILTKAHDDQMVKEATVAAQQRIYNEARAADMIELDHMMAAPAVTHTSPIIWGR